MALLANLEIRGQVTVPKDATLCAGAVTAIGERLSSARTRFEQLAGSRTGTETMQTKVTDLLVHWHTHGRVQ